MGYEMYAGFGIIIRFVDHLLFFQDFIDRIMSRKLRFALVALVCFPAFCFGQEKIVLKPTFPEGKFLYKQEREDVAYESFYRPLFDFRSNTPRKLKTEMEMVLYNVPPNEDGFVRTDVEITKLTTSEESPEEETLDPEESRQELQRKTELDNYRRVVLETPLWSLVDPKARRVLEVHGYDQIWEKLYEMTEEPFWKECYQEAKVHHGDESKRNAMESVLRFYPNDPVSLDDQWKYSQIERLPILCYRELEFTSTLKEIKTNQAGKQIAVIESRSEWKTDAPQILDPWGNKYLQLEASIDTISELDIETGMAIFQEKRIKVVAKQKIQYDDGLYLVAFVVEQTEKTTTERMDE